VLKLKAKVIIGIDLAEKPKNPTGWALEKQKSRNDPDSYK